MPSMRKLLAQPRAPRWRIMLLNERDEPKRDISKWVSTGSFEVASTTRLRASGSLMLGQEADVDFLRDRVQIFYNPGIPGVDEWSLGIALFTSPEVEDAPLRVSREVEILGKLTILDEDGLQSSFSLDEGANAIDEVVKLIQSTGETRIAFTPTDKLMANPRVWEAGTSKLTVINDLLTAAGYWAVWTDREGQFRVEPYVDPNDRVDSWLFAEDDYSLLTPTLRRTQDLAGIPNRYVVRGTGDDEEPAISAYAENTDPESPFSYENRGKRWITRTQEGVESDDEEVLQQLADRRLREAMSPVAAVQAVHGIVPLQPNDIVLLETENWGSVRMRVQRMAYQLDYDSQCSAEWREVNLLGESLEDLEGGEGV